MLPLRGMQVLLVEDKKINQKLANDLMKSWHVNVEISSIGQEAIYCLESHVANFFTWFY
jgi:CheY-like chemotaxis protein